MLLKIQSSVNMKSKSKNRNLHEKSIIWNISDGIDFHSTYETSQTSNPY